MILRVKNKPRGVLGGGQWLIREADGDSESFLPIRVGNFPNGGVVWYYDSRLQIVQYQP